MDTTTSDVALSYGLAVGMWLTPNWQLTTSAHNPIVRYARLRQEQGPDNVRVDSETSFGIIWAPEVRVMIHLYY